MSDLDSFLKGPTPAVEQPKAEAPPEVKAEAPEPTETEAQKAARERDEKGRFKAKSEEPAQAEAKPEAPKVEKPTAPTAVEKPKETKQDEAEPLDPKARAYYTKAKDEQRKRQAVEQELQQLRAQLQQQQQPQQQVNPQQPQQAPPGFDPLWDMALNTSEIAARDKYGDDAVDEAQMWFKDQMAASPGLYESLRHQRHPYKWVIQQFRQAKLLEEVGDDPDGYREKLKAQHRAEWEAENAQRQQVPARPAPAVPPPSLASAPSTGNQQKPPEWSGPPPLKNIVRR